MDCFAILVGKWQRLGGWVEKEGVIHKNSKQSNKIILTNDNLTKVIIKLNISTIFQLILEASYYIYQGP